MRGVHLGATGVDLSAGFNLSTGLRKVLSRFLNWSGVAAGIAEVAEPAEPAELAEFVELVEFAEPASAVVVLAAPGVSGKDAGVAAGGGASVG